MNSYRISGLAVSSQLELPGAIAMAEPDGHPDVTVRLAPVPQALDLATSSGPTWAMDDDAFLLRVPRLARFLIRGGREICVELESGATARDASGFVLGASFGILLHQRGDMVLHGAAVAKNGRAIVICGQSGAGKSTLAAALCREGFELVADDICVVSSDAKRGCVVLPDGRQLKLWRESIDRLDLATRQGEAVRESFEKYFIEPQSSTTSTPSLAAIFVLREARAPLKEGIEPLAPPDAIRLLDRQAYRPELRARLGSKPQRLAQAAGLLVHAKVFTLVRPLGFEHIPQTVALLRDHCDAMGP